MADNGFFGVRLPFADPGPGHAGSAGVCVASARQVRRGGGGGGDDVLYGEQPDLQANSVAEEGAVKEIRGKGRKINMQIEKDLAM